MKIFISAHVPYYMIFIELQHLCLHRMLKFRIIHVGDIAWKVEERYMVRFLCDPETASRETDFTFLRNKAHNVRCTISSIFTYRRLLGHKIFHLFMKYFSVMYSCGSFPRRKQNAAQTVSQNFCSETRTCRYYGVNQNYKSTYIRARCSLRNV